MGLTVQALILGDDGKILLVHERGAAESGKSLHIGGAGKPPGWGLPGGGVDQSEEYLLKQIQRFLPVYRLSEEKFFAILYNPAIIEPILTLIKECIEETGLLVHPRGILLKRKIASDHEVWVMQAEILDGKIEKSSVETDDCNWFPFDNLPEGTYSSHRWRISCALRELGVETKTAESTGETGGVP